MKNKKKYEKPTIDVITDDIEDLEKYETVKVSVLEREFSKLRNIETPLLLSNNLKISYEDEEMNAVIAEVNVFRSILKRIRATIYEQIKKFDGYPSVLGSLQAQIRILDEMERFALFYRNTTSLDHLKTTHTKLGELLQKFKDTSRSIRLDSAKELKQAA